MRLNFEPVSAAIGAIAILLALSLSSAQAPHQADRIARELRVAGIPAPEDMILIREGLPFVVPDGKIFVLPVERVYRIRTGEQDEAAVTPILVPA